MGKDLRDGRSRRTGRRRGWKRRRLAGLRRARRSTFTSAFSVAPFVNRAIANVGPGRNVVGAGPSERILVGVRAPSRARSAPRPPWRSWWIDKRARFCRHFRHFHPGSCGSAGRTSPAQAPHKPRTTRAREAHSPAPRTHAGNMLPIGLSLGSCSARASVGSPSSSSSRAFSSSVGRRRHSRPIRRPAGSTCTYTCRRARPPEASWSSPPRPTAFRR